MLSLCLVAINNLFFSQDSTQIDWQEFYPLHIGDFWKYYERYGGIPVTFTKRVISQDTVKDDAIYKRILNIDHTFNYEFLEYQRVDSLGDVYKYDQYDRKEYLIYKLNACVGDTWPDFREGYWRVENRFVEVTENDSTTHIYILRHDNVLHGEYQLTEGLGVAFYGFEGGYRYLVGACINGLIFGDTTLTSVQHRKEEQLPTTITLHQNFPNPFNHTTKICYEIQKGGDVTLRIYDIRGKFVTQLVNQKQQAGMHVVDWDGRTQSGEEAPSGIYYYQLNVAEEKKSKRLLLLR